MILHIDMDAFYASIEERERPELVGKPVIVGGSVESRGVVSTANYVARKFGVHSAMPTAQAKRLCPHGIFLSGNMRLYAEVSRHIRDIFFRFTPLVEPLSLDEAFLDVTGSERLFGSAEKIGREIKRLIREETRLTGSVGLAPNKFLAKVASALQKPDGFVIVSSEGVQEFLDPLPVERVWGVGKHAAESLRKLGIRTVRQLRDFPQETLKRVFGSSGESFWLLAQGIDERAVVPDRDAKSISHETTFAADIANKETLRAWLAELTDQVGRRLRRHKLRGRIVHLKIRFADFRLLTRSQKLPAPTDVTEEILQTAVEMLMNRLPPRHLPIRLIGVGISGLDDTGTRQRSLFDEEERDKQVQLDLARDKVAAQFGIDALMRGSSMKRMN